MEDFYKCMNCGLTFSRSDAARKAEFYGEGSNRGPVYYLACPGCGCDEIADAEECKVCGVYDDKDCMVLVNGDYFCKNCAEQIAEEFLWVYGMTERTQNAVDVFNAREARLAKGGAKNG